MPGPKTVPVTVIMLMLATLLVSFGGSPPASSFYGNKILVQVKLNRTELSGKAGIKFCGQHLPNYPAPSVFASGECIFVILSVIIQIVNSIENENILHA